MTATSDSILLTIVVPVYNGKDTIAELVRQIASALAESPYEHGYEVILVNDQGRSDVWPIIRHLAEQNLFVRGVDLRRNFGQHNATMAGLSYARGNVIIIMDEDLQHPPSAILPLARAVHNGVDVCYTRYRNRKHVVWKRWGSAFNDLVARWLLKKPRGLYLSSFKAMKQDVAREILRYTGPYPYIDGLLLSVTRSIEVIDIDHQHRLAGESSYGLKRLISLWLRMATGASIYPLRIATFCGFGIAASSAVALLVIIAQKLIDPAIEPGWTSTISAILMIGGLQMVFLGIIGEYVGRIYMGLNKSPQFSIRETTFGSKARGGDPEPLPLDGDR
jgi:undecaprenyl-phosphate 4-deoxy-4-formamido-L-arabinose transferase